MHIPGRLVQASQKGHRNNNLKIAVMVRRIEDLLSLQQMSASGPIRRTIKSHMISRLLGLFMELNALTVRLSQSDPGCGKALVLLDI
jgi:hypothetical protein